MTQYTFNKFCEPDRLVQEIKYSSIAKQIDYVTTSSVQTVVTFLESLSTEEQTTLGGIVAAHEAITLFRANYHASSWAVDKNNTNQSVIGTSVQKITAERVLWDNDQDFDLDEDIFIPGSNGVWNLNGTVAVTPGLTCTRINLHLYRNEELYFTVASEPTGVSNTKRFIVFSCDFDAYITSGHYFDLRIELEGTLPTATISGSDEETAWGASFIVGLSGESPT